MFESYLKPPISFPTLTGSIVTFNAQYAGLPLKSHKIALTATQSGSGTPSPNNVRSINEASAIHIQNTCGINQWDEVWEVGTYDSSGQKAVDNRMIRNKNLIRITPSTTYYAKSAGVALIYLFYDANRNYISTNYVTDNTFTSPANAYYMNFRMSADYGNVYNNNISINYPSTDTSYHAFVGQSVTIQIGSTVYGGEYDARTGVLTVTHKGGIFDGSESWTYYTTANSFYLENAFDVDNTFRTGSVCMCNWLAESSYIGNSAQMLDKPDLIFCNQETYPKRLWVKMAQFTTETDFKNYLSSNNLVIVYPLSTPTTIQLPPCPIDTLVGVNNIWTDTGDTTLQYPKFG